MTPQPHNPLISDDATIDRVLDKLGRAAPPPQMETRLVRALNARAVSPTGSNVLPWAAGLAMAGVLAGMFLAGANHRSGRHAGHATQAAALPAPLADHGPGAPGLTVQVSAAPVQRCQSAACSARSQGIPRAGSSSAMSLAMDEMRAPSTPEPALPLTDQERMLVALARRGRPEAIAALDPMSAPTFASGPEPSAEFISAAAPAARQRDEQLVAQLGKSLFAGLITGDRP